MTEGTTMPAEREATIRVGGLQSGLLPIRFPMAMFAPHGRQAQRNHGGQTLARLEERGGLSWCEAAAILQDRDWHRMLPDVAEATVRGFYERYKREESTHE